MIKLSIIIPIYNSRNYIGKCIQSLMDQTIEDVEYILINDATQDDSFKIVDEIIDSYPNRKDKVIVITHDENKGLAYTRSEGLRLSRGEYVIFCDSDDWVDSKLYEEMLILAMKHNADIVTCPFTIEADKVFHRWSIPAWSNWSEFFLYPKWRFLAIWAHMIRRMFLLENKLDFYPDINYAEDYGLLFRCYYYSKINISYKGPYYYHYTKTNSDSLTNNRFNNKNLKHKEKCLQYLSEFVNSVGYNSDTNIILSQEKRAVKEGYLLAQPPDFYSWRNAFPETTKVVLKDKKLSFPYRVAWALGQYLHPCFLKFYLRITRSSNI